MARTYSDFNEYLNTLPIEELQERNDAELAETAKDFQELKAALTMDQCSICGKPLTHFSEKKPCFHWLLGQAKGFKKRHFQLLYEQQSFNQINSYLRWVANSGDTLMRNINDIADERACSKLIEETIRYKNLEWSFSCSHGDMEGHKDSHEGKMPHYHFQMKVDGRVIINYNGFHVPFSEYDHFCFAVQRGEFDRLHGGHIEGAGMQAYFEQFSPEELLDHMQKSPNEDDSKQQFNIQTMIMADEGTTISGNDLADIFKEHNRTGVPIAKLIRRLENIKATSFITAGPGVPEIATRKPNRKRGL